MHQLGIGGFGDETRSRYIIVQSTNLFDKDGKEIWEGSIVDYNDDGEALGIVVGIDGQWQLKRQQRSRPHLRAAQWPGAGNGKNTRLEWSHRRSPKTSQGRNSKV